MWSIDKRSVRDLIQNVLMSQLALPQFQRESVWGKADWTPFLVTVLRGRPTGTLLLLETNEDVENFAPRAIDGAPTVDRKKLKWLLLDGQQRMTTLFRALEIGFKVGASQQEAVLDVKSVLKRGSLSDEDLSFVKAGDVADHIALAATGKVALKTLLNPGHLAVWEHEYAAQHMQGEHAALARLVNQLEELLPGFRALANYEFPILTINADAPLDVVVDIFEGMNRRGQRLNQFDLMVARLYREHNGSYYDLRNEWRNALSSSLHLQNLGIGEGDGMLPLQLIAMQYSRLNADPRFAKVKGLNNSDVLELPAEAIIGSRDSKSIYRKYSLERAVKALDEAAEFLTRICGVACKQLLPQQSMLLPIADQFLQPKTSRLSETNLKKWFFAVGLVANYYGGVNSYADRDCKELTEWAASGAAPDSVTSFTADVARALQLQKAMRREGAIVGASLMALLVSAGALDWRQGQISVHATAEAVEFHHMVPEQSLKAFLPKAEDRRPIAGMTPITRSVNASIRDKDPDQVFRKLGADSDPIMASHQVDPAVLAKGPKNAANFETFLEDREKRLREFVVTALGL